MTLSSYLIQNLGDLNDILGYVEADLSGVVTDTLLDYGVATENLATDLKKLYALGKARLYEKVITDLIGAYNFSADGASYNRNQMVEAAKYRYQCAFLDAMPYLPGYTVVVDEITTEYDPYQVYPNYFERYE